jgi:hypothetical protein
MQRQQQSQLCYLCSHSNMARAPVVGADLSSCCAFLTIFPVAAGAVVRAAAAAALLPQNIRKKFPLVLGRINQLITRLDALGPHASVDVSAPHSATAAAACMGAAVMCGAGDCEHSWSL